jgi:hypothetical protein
MVVPVKECSVLELAAWRTLRPGSTDRSSSPADMVGLARERLDNQLTNARRMPRGQSYEQRFKL